MRWPSRRAAGSAAVVLAVAGALTAQRPVPDANAPVTDGVETPEVFRRFAGQVVKLQVVEVGADARENTGTGFFVSGDGHVLTNYHVVAGLVHKPDRYRAELLDSAGAEHDVRVIAVDAVHDLALLASDRRPPHWFTLGEVRTVQGQRLYSLGHPGDLGIAIVEGTYNGRLPHTLYPRIHFTGAINPGMSGGPAITLDGRVVGVNVATMGNERGFLVPVDDAARFVSRSLAAPARPVDSLLGDVGRQLLAYQDAYLSRLFDGPVPTVTLGAWRLPTEPSDVFQCWGESDRDPEQPWELVHHFCSTGDDVFLTADQSAGIIEFEHDWFRSTRLNRFRFHALLSSHVGQLALDYDLDRKGDEEVTGYRCRTGNLREGTLVARTIVCARAYKRLPGLYDVVLRLATVGRPRDAVISTLTLSGVSWDNGQRVVRRYLGAIAGAP